jgi:putative FmdB family regulatory protein
MPTYEYRCDACGSEWEIEQRITEDAIRDCPKCGKPKATRLVGAGNFILKGGGWYADLYSSQPKKKSSESEGKSDSKSEGKSEGKSDSKSEGKSDSKSEGKSDSKSEGKSDAKPKSDSKPKSDKKASSKD